MSQIECARVHARIPYKYIINNAKRLIKTGDCVLKEGNFDLQVYDLSKGGMGVETNENLLEGSFLSFDIAIEDIKYTIMGIVKWKKPGELTHRYGIEFVGTGNMLYRHIDVIAKHQSFFHLTDQENTERRRQERREILQEAICSEICRDANIEGERFTNRAMQMHDLTFQGTKLYSSQRLATGAVISIKFVKFNKVVLLQGKIVWSKYSLKGSSGMKYASGIEFINLNVEDLHIIKKLLS